MKKTEFRTKRKQISEANAAEAAKEINEIQDIPDVIDLDYEREMEAFKNVE